MTYPVLKNHLGYEFSVSRDWNGKFKIMKNDPFAMCLSDAWLFDEVLFDRVEPFDSGIKAYSFMKNHLENLI